MTEFLHKPSATRYLQNFFLVTAFLLAVTPSWGEPVTLYSYDSANHLRQATVSTGLAIRYNYDLAGNLTSTVELAPTELKAGSTAIPGLSSGQSALMRFSADGATTVTLLFSSTSPTTYNVYDSSGELVATLTGSGDVVITLPDLQAGSYIVIATPTNGTTANVSVSTTGIAGTPPWLPAILDLILQ